MSVVSNTEENVKKALSLASQNNKNNQNYFYESRGNFSSIKIMVFPEMFTTGFCDLATIHERAHDLSSPVLIAFKELAKMQDSYIVLGSLALKNQTDKGRDGKEELIRKNSPPKITNTTFVINREGEIISRYDKRRLFPLMDESSYLSAGSEPHLFYIENIFCTSLICYDLRFPRLVEDVRKKGRFKILFIPVQWPASRATTFKILAQARAIENKCFVVLVNCVGKDKVGCFTGGSLVISPTGEILKEMDDREGCEDFMIDLTEIDNIPKQLMGD